MYRVPYSEATVRASAIHHRYATSPGGKDKSLVSRLYGTRPILLRIALLGCALCAILLATVVSTGQQAGAASTRVVSRPVTKKLDPATVLGVALNGTTPLPGISWVKDRKS